MNNPFTGCGTALITPFAADGSLDEAAFRRLLDFQLGHGMDFLVPCGTTGETPTLERAEHLRLIELAVAAARAAKRPAQPRPGPLGDPDRGEQSGTRGALDSRGQSVAGAAAQGPAPIKVLGGAGGNNTAHVIALARELESRGVDGVLTVAPYYNKPTQEGLYQHFSAIAAAVKVPVVLYNVPGRTSSNIEPATVLRLAQVPNIVAVKEASGNLAQIGAILAGAPAGFDVLSGDDGLTLAILALGGKGLISVASNPAPAAMVALVAAARAGDFAKARELHFRLLPLMEALFVESSPAPAKCLMAQMGLCQEVLRLPLVPVRPATRDRLAAVRRALGL